MPIFAHIETEAEVQINDRTRLEAIKTHVTQNQPVFTALAIQPGSDSVPFNVYDKQRTLRYLDWEFNSWTMDIDSTNNKVDFQEAGTNLVATVPDGTYLLADLVNEICTHMTTATTVGAVYSNSIDLDNRITLSSTKGFNLLNETGSNRLVSIINKLFFPKSDQMQAMSYKSHRVQYLTKKVSTIAGTDTLQVQTVTNTGDVSGSLNNTYFIVYSYGDSIKFYVWNNVGGVGTDPALPGYTGVEVAFAANSTATIIAAAQASALNVDGDFVATSALGVLTFSHATPVWNTPSIDSVAAPTDFTFAVTVPGEAQSTESIYMNVFSIMGDYLWSNDSDLMQYEPDIRKWIVDGRNSFMNVHRQAQKTILEWLDRNGFVNIYREKYHKFDLIDISEVKEWSRFLALRMIFEGIKNSQDDLYSQKRASYESREIDARSRAILRIDTDKSGTLFPDEGFDTNSIRLGFR